MDMDTMTMMCEEVITNIEKETAKYTTYYDEAMQLVAENRRKAETYTAIANEIERKAIKFKGTLEDIAEKKADFVGMLDQINGQFDKQKITEKLESYIQGNVVRFERK